LYLPYLTSIIYVIFTKLATITIRTLLYLATHLIGNPFCLKTEPISIFMEHGSHKDALKVKGRPLISPKPRKYLYANRICLKREAFAHLWRSTRDFHNARGDCGKGMAFGTSCRLIPFGHWPGCLRFSDSPRTFGWQTWKGQILWSKSSLRVANLAARLFVYLLIYAATRASWGPTCRGTCTLIPLREPLTFSIGPGLCSCIIQNWKIPSQLPNTIPPTR